MAGVVYSALVSGALCIAATSQSRKNGLTDDRQLDQQAAPSYRYHVAQLVAVLAAVCSADCHIGPPASLGAVCQVFFLCFAGREVCFEQGSSPQEPMAGLEAIAIPLQSPPT